METLHIERIAEAESKGLSPDSALAVKQSFAPCFSRAKEWLEKSKAVTVSDESQTREMKMAREYRLALRDIRLDAEAARKSLKEDSLRRGKAIDGFANILKGMIEPEEERLKQCENFAEIQAAKRKESLRFERAELIQKYVTDISAYNLGDMSESDFNNLLKFAKSDFESKLEAQAKAERDRIERERIEREERERIRAENEAFRRQAEELKRLAEEEKRARLKAEAEAKRVENERIKAEAEAKKRKEEEERRAMSAPDRQQLMMIRDWFRQSPMRNIKDGAILLEVSALFDQFDKSICNIIKRIS